MKRSLIVAAMALGLAVTPVTAQTVPELVDGVWVLPTNDVPESAGMGPDTGYAQSGYEQAIYDACAVYGCDPGQLIRVMYCESGGDHSAVGPNGERGIFQYHPNGMWPEMAWAGPYEQIWHAAQQFASGNGGQWVCQ
jgi:hypothetical protein